MWERHWPCYAERRRNPHSACSGGATFKELRKLEWNLCWELWRIWDLPSFHAYQWACYSSMNAGKSHEISWPETKDVITHSNNINICTTSLSPNSYNTERARTTWTLSKLHYKSRTLSLRNLNLIYYALKLPYALSPKAVHYKKNTLEIIIWNKGSQCICS